MKKNSKQIPASVLEYSERVYELTHYQLLFAILLDIMQSVLIDMDASAAKLGSTLTYSAKLTVSRMRQNMKSVFSAISTLNTTANAKIRQGYPDMADISDAINDFVRLFYPNADYTDDDRETLAVNVIRAFEECKKLKEGRKKAEQLIIDKYLTR